MTNTKYFIAVDADPSQQTVIYGIGHTAEEAIDDAVKGAAVGDNVREDSTVRDIYGDIVEELFVAQECTAGLYALVQNKGGAGLSWGKNGRLMDVIPGSIEDLAAQLVAAAKQFQEDGEGVPNVIYAQLSNDDGWRAAFLQDSNALDTEMTRWSTGQDVIDLYADFLADNMAAVTDYAGDIVHGWDSDWTN